MASRPDTATSIMTLVGIMEQLRTPVTGCPWDVEQTFETIAPYTIEEAYEVADAIERQDMDDLRDELGDLLLQIVFHSRMAEEANLFHLGEVADTISEKMIRRHPHVFGDAMERDSNSQTIAWEDQKAQERSEKAAKNDSVSSPSVLDGVAITLPALTRALKLQKRAARVGFDWADARLVLEKLREEIDELETELDAAESDTAHDTSRVEDEVGDLLFTCVNIARQLAIDPEIALRHGNAKFERRFRALEANVADMSLKPEDMTLEELESAWSKAKAQVG